MRARRDGYKGAVLKQHKGNAVREEHYPNRDDYRHVWKNAATQCVAESSEMSLKTSVGC